MLTAIDLYHAAAIFVRFPVYASKIVAQTLNTYKVPDYFLFQPRFGHII